MAEQKKKRRRNRHDPNRSRAAAQREEAKRRERETRRREAQAAERRAARIAMFKRWGRFALVGLAVTVVALWLFRPSNELEGVEAPDEIRAVELVPGDTYDYGTTTPTSGPFYKDAQECGIFEETVTPEAAATAIYYGAVVLWHQPELEDAQLDALVAAAGEYDSHVVISPQEGLPAPIVATAWNRLLEYETADGVADFLDRYRKNAPGDGDCPTGG